MALGEFELIRRFFENPGEHSESTIIGIGDDCAVLQCPPGMELAVTVDTLVEGVHFLPDVDPESLGHKSLAVNLSDLAAMGAEPRWLTLALTLPTADENWLKAFARGFFALAKQYRVDLVGGDTTRGPLSVSVQAMGLIPAGQALKRSGAEMGDSIYISGVLGSAGLGLKVRLGESSVAAEDAIRRLEKPEPQVRLGQLIRGIASACIDISDGLAADLGHILSASGVGATLQYEKLPLTTEVLAWQEATGDLSLPLMAGDDYELCFTVPRNAESLLNLRLLEQGLKAYQIGRIDQEPGLRIYRHGQKVGLTSKGYQHF